MNTNPLLQSANRVAGWMRESGFTANPELLASNLQYIQTTWLVCGRVDSLERCLPVLKTLMEAVALEQVQNRRSASLKQTHPAFADTERGEEEI